MLTLPALEADERIALVGAFDPNERIGEAFASEFAKPRFGSLDALLAAPEVDAVYIASPHGFHAEQASRALLAGKHVLVEKPMAISVADCVAMADTAERTGRVLVVGPSHGFDAPVRAAADLIASGRYGEPRLVTALNFTDFMYRPRRPEELDPALGGGVVLSQATHQIDVVRRLVRREVETVRAVTGDWDPRRRSDGAYAALLRFEGGAAASLTYSGYAHYDSDELVGWISELGRDKDPDAYGAARRALAGLSPGDEVLAKDARSFGGGAAPRVEGAAPHHEHFGFVIASCDRADLRITPTGVAVYGDERREFLPVDPPTVPRRAVIDEFANAILAGARPVHDGRWGAATMACCAALVESGRLQADVAPAAMFPEWSEI